MSKLAPPLPEESLSRIAQKVFTPISTHDCVTVCMVPGGGKRVLMNYFLLDRTNISKILGAQAQSYLFIYINPDDIIAKDQEAYLNLIHHALLDEVRKRAILLSPRPADTKFEALKQTLETLIELGWYVVFVLQDFEITLTMSEFIYRNLESLMAVNKSQIMYIFLVGADLFQPESINSFSNLKYAISQNTVYIPLMSQEDIRFVLYKYSHNHQLLANEKFLIDACGGHPQLLKYAISILGDKKYEYNDFVELCGNTQIQLILQDIWYGIDTYEKSKLIVFAQSGVYESSPQSFIEKVGILIENPDHTWRLFGKLFGEYIKSHAPKINFEINEKDGDIKLQGRSVGHQFTAQEFTLLLYLSRHSGEITSRDAIGRVLWGSKYFEKYSDYMIDKLISTIRKKLSSLGIPPNTLVTVKKRGVRFVMPQ